MTEIIDKGEYMNKQKVDFIFVVVVYRNVEDIIDLLESIKKQDISFKTILVNNFYDDSTKDRFEKIALEYACDFINCENRGYGAGNNTGIKWALEKYEFSHLVVSNPDIVIKKFPIDEIRQYGKGVLGPNIYNLSNRIQNPMIVKDISFATRMLYKGLKKDNNLALFVGKCINRVMRDLGKGYLMHCKKGRRRVYQVHGSFLIFTKDVLDRIGAPYDENMFLFGEEGYLAYLLKKEAIPSYYCPEVEVLHKEDGSMKFRNDIGEECKKASIYFFEKYYFSREEVE